MQLTGYRRACGRRSGGIRTIALVRADAVTGVEYDYQTGCYSAISLETGVVFAVYRFKEDEAGYEEKVVAEGGPVIVRHTLSLMLERMDIVSANAIKELCEVSAEGMIAIVTTQNDVSFLVGYSEKFEKEYPLRLQECFGSSGRKLTDMCAENILLASTDTAKAYVFTGEMPQ